MFDQAWEETLMATRSPGRSAKSATEKVDMDPAHQKEPKGYTKLKAVVPDILADQQREAPYMSKRERSRERHSNPSRSFQEG